MLWHRPRRLLALLLLSVVAAPLAAAPARAAQDVPPLVAQAAPQILQTVAESEPNNSVSAVPASDQADQLGPADPLAVKNWTQRANGAIGSAGDVDYFRFTLARPASAVKITLGNLSADYDLVLAGGPAVAEQGEPGLDGIADVGASITSIGASITSIGASITSIGASITSIGASITSIGASITSISAQPGTAAEQIETTLWLPGTYYLAVTAANGDFGTSYSLDLTVLGSALNPAPAPPEVELRGRPASAPATEITTLYLVNTARMNQLYTARTDGSAIATVEGYLRSLANLGPNPAARLRSTVGRPEYGYVLDIADLQAIGSTAPISDVYRLWDNNQANPFHANVVAGLIDNLIEAVSDRDTPGISGPNAKYGLGTMAEPPLFFPNLRYVVLVGGDDSLPFFRLPDLTTIANEADYLAYTNTVAGGLLDETQALGAALKNRTILSDNPYGALRPYRFPGSPLFVPRLAVGRLVETPDDIRRYLYRYYGPYFGDGQPPFNDGAFRIEPIFGEGAEAFVSGYDFLKDQASEVSRTLGLGGFVEANTATTTGLINDTWTRTDLERDWFNGELDTFFSDSRPNDPFASQSTSLSSVNAHFDHWQILPAKDTAGNFEARRLLAPDYDISGCVTFPCYPGYFGQTLGYSVGCHSGYNVMPRAMSAVFRQINQTPVQQILTDRYSADFAQATISHGGNWIGNTGYGYGTLDGVDYSERLSVLLSEQLLTNVTDPLSSTVYVGQGIGDALVQARLRYLRNASSLSAYDAKSVHVMTLYGLPYIRFFGDPNYLLNPPREEGVPGVKPPAERPAPVPTPSASGLLERTISFDIDNRDFRPVPRTGSSELVLDPADFTVSDSFVTAGFPAQPVRVFENNQVGVPELPRFAYDISALNQLGNARLIVRDVQFVEGSYGERQNFNPQVTQIVSETDSPLINTAIEPSFAAGAGIWYPDKFFGFSSVGSGDDLRDQLVAAAAQFRAEPNGVTGLLRPYSRMVFKVTYIDPRAADAPTTLADIRPPAIETVRLEQGSQTSATRQAATARIVVLLDRGGPGVRVQANYVQGGSWKNILFSRPNPSGAPNRYVAELPQLVGDVRVIVRATDAAGNTSYFTAKGRFSVFDKQLNLPLLMR